jgi:hypothetical protein
MTNSSGNAKRKLIGPTIPKGSVLGEFTNYSDATAMVEKLLLGEFRPENISLIGHNPLLVERIRSRLGYGRVGLSGAMTGLWIGLIFALLVGAGITVSPEGELSYNPQQFFATVVISAGLGMLINIIRFSLGRTKRGFLSTQMPVAARWEVVVPDAEAGKARNLLGLASDS